MVEAAQVSQETLVLVITQQSVDLVAAAHHPAVTARPAL
jgi:hypothetical protein